MFSKVIILAFCLLFSRSLVLSSTAVRWDQGLTNGKILSSGVAVDSAGNILVTGGTAVFGRGQSLAFLLKYDASGKLLCLKTWGGPQDTFGYAVVFDSSNNIYVTGATQSFGGQSPDVFLVKYDSSCNLLFQVAWGGAGNDLGRGVAVDAFDNVYVTGSTDSFGAGLSDIFLLKYDPAGEFQFSKTWGGTQNDHGSGIATDGSGNIYITGTTLSSGSKQQAVVLLKYDSSGNLLFQKTWGGAQNDYGSGIAVDSGDNVYLTGYTYSFAVTPGVASVFLLKYDPSGNLLFQKTWGGTQSDYGFGIAVDSAGNVYLTGSSNSFGGGQSKVFLLKFDSSGNQLFLKTWGGLKGDYGYAVAVDGSGNIYIAGYTYSFGPNRQGVNLFLLKYDLSGSLLFQRAYGGGAPAT